MQATFIAVDLGTRATTEGNGVLGEQAGPRAQPQGHAEATPRGGEVDAASDRAQATGATARVGRGAWLGFHQPIRSRGHRQVAQMNLERMAPPARRCCERRGNPWHRPDLYTRGEARAGRMAGECPRVFVSRNACLTFIGGVGATDYPRTHAERDNGNTTLKAGTNGRSGAWNRARVLGLLAQPQVAERDVSEAEARQVTRAYASRTTQHGPN